MDKKTFWLGFATGVLLLILSGFYFYNKIFDQEGYDLDQLKVETLEGEKVTLESYNDKPIVLNYWATWCAPCLKEFPDFEEIKKEYGDKVNFIMVSDESADKIRKFIDKNPYSFTFLRTDTKLSEIGIIARPVTYLYNNEGKLVSQYVTQLDADGLRKMIEAILKN
jgi:thiol-disulfide isomerase/thioredoxin